MVKSLRRAAAKSRLYVQHSAAGYYLGFFCPQCGPYSRESDYFRKREAANAALAS